MKKFKLVFSKPNNNYFHRKRHKKCKHTYLMKKNSDKKKDMNF